MFALQFTFDIGEQAYINGSPILNGANVLNQITFSNGTNVISANYDSNNHKILVTLSYVTAHRPVTLKNTITDQAGNNIIATNAEWILYQPNSPNKWEKR
ncbi:hypothetical protein [Lysinibacillus fusiformis]|uniref:hypothetical protein n=1 Tax=Lysinibacillus fusiformis TaxID=28031 RepID=UPI00148D36C6|nr:hypothetical protein [Lysinibacillus fusiformis]NOG28540.1 hypothetical protein [Lysinibacillus fusiformis]